MKYGAFKNNLFEASKSEHEFSSPKFFSAFIISVFLISASYVILVNAAPNPPDSNITFYLNSTLKFDNDGVFTINWTDTQTESISNYTVYIYNMSDSSLMAASNTSEKGYLFTGVNDGNYTFNISAVNATGTEGPNATSAWIYVDTVSPTISVNDPTNNAVLNYVPQINGTVTETNIESIKTNSTYFDSIDNSTPFNFTNSSAIPEGTYTINISANDSAGNVGWANITFTYDITSPIITILSPTNITYSTKSVWFNMTSDETLDWAGYSLDGAANVTLTNSSGNWNDQNTTMSEGQHNVTFYVNDSAGNINVSGTVYFTITAIITCQSLTIENASYVLTSNINASGSCFTIGANNITLDGAGYTVNYSRSETGYAINNSGGYDNITIKNMNIVQQNSSVQYAHAMYFLGMIDSVIINNTIISSSNNSHGIHIYSSSNSNNISDNVVELLNVGSYAVYLNGSNSNEVVGGSYVSQQSYDYYIQNTGSGNNIKDTNFTGLRKIYFADTTSYFNYNNNTISNIWLKTNVSSQSSLNRTLTNWNQTLMQWNDTNSSSGLSVNYIITGLLPEVVYNIYNTSEGNESNSYNLTTDSDGNLPGFIINLNGNIDIKVQTPYGLSSCQDLTEENRSYTLIQNISSAGTCFNILANNITLNGQGYTINYSQTSLGYGINSTGYNYTKIKNTSIIQANESITNAYAIYVSGMNSGVISNNIITTSGDNSSGIYSYISESNTISNNIITTYGVSGTGVVLNESNSTTLLGNNITALNTTSEGISLISSFLNIITGGSIVSAKHYDYFLKDSGTSNNFTNTNFTAQRNISFNDATSYFNYKNNTNAKIVLKTNVSASSYLTRTLVSWNESLMQWNDTNSTEGVVANYIITGLSANAKYYISNTSEGVNTLAYIKNTDSNGVLPAFSIAIKEDTEIKVDGAPIINTTSPLSSGYYSSSWIWSNITLNENASWCGVSLNDTANISMLNTSLSSWYWNLSVPYEGSNNVTIYCNDTAGNMGNSSIIVFTKDITQPILSSITATSVTASAYDITWNTNEATNSTLYYGTSTSTSSNSTSSSYITSHSRTLTSLSASTTYYYNVSNCDRAGNCNTSAQYSFTTAAATSDDSSDDSSSSSNANVNTNTDGGLSKTWASITSGTRETMSISSSLVDVTQITLRVSQTVSNVKLSVSKLSGKPSGVSTEPSGKIYQYISITTENITDSKISSGTVSFKVNKTWMSQNNIDNKSIVLYRYSKGAWNALSTYPAEGSTADYNKFLAETPGFSYFAIVANPKSSDPVVPHNTSSEESGNTSQNINLSSSLNNNTLDNSTGIGENTTSYSSSLTVFLIVALIIVISAAIYYKKPLTTPHNQKYSFKHSGKKTADLVYKKPDKKEKFKYKYELKKK